MEADGGRLAHGRGDDHCTLWLYTMFTLLMVYISLLTCSPGDELYAAYGHTAICVYDDERMTDLCYNYGTFSFDTEHFYWKFVRGETYYSLTAKPTRYFFDDYTYENRQVYEQLLNLSQEQAIAVRDALEANCLPENSDYLYNFVFDNCATRPYHLLKEVLQDSLCSTYRGWEGRTYREFISHYTRPHTVQNALINMVFGSQADQPMHGEERLFLPEELMRYTEKVTLSNGQPLVHWTIPHTPYQVVGKHLSVSGFVCRWHDATELL